MLEEEEGRLASANREVLLHLLALTLLLDPVLVVVCIIIYALLGLTADVLVRILERFSMPWRRHLAVR